jgi:Leucine-rich repeat (LRR) protein
MSPKVTILVTLTLLFGRILSAQDIPPLPADEVKAWKSAGARFERQSPTHDWIDGWSLERQPVQSKPVPAIPVFVFDSVNSRAPVPEGVLKSLPKPSQPFGVDLYRNSVAAGAVAELADATHLIWFRCSLTDTTINDLAGIKSLRWLELRHVSDARLADVAKLQQLEFLVLIDPDNKLTAAGLKEIVALKNLRTLHLEMRKINDGELSELAKMDHLTSLFLRGQNGAGTGLTGLPTLKGFSGLKNLETLRLRIGDLNKAGMQEIAGMKDLRSLDLGSVSLPGLEGLSSLTKLEDLDLSDTYVGIHSLRELTLLTNLRTLALNNTGGGREGDRFKGFSRLKNLTWLGLGRSGLTDEQLTDLVSFEHLEQLKLSGNDELTGKGVSFAGLKKLSRLDLSATKFDDEGLRAIDGLKTLKGLNLRFTGVTDLGLKHLRNLDDLTALEIGHTIPREIIGAANGDQSKAFKAGYPISVAGLKEVAGLNALTTLTVWTSAVRESQEAKGT